MPIYRLTIIFSIISPTPKWHRREDKEGTEHLLKSLESEHGKHLREEENFYTGNQRKRDEYCDLGSRHYCLKKLNCNARWSNAFFLFSLGLRMCFWYLLLHCGKPCSQRTSEQICWQVWEIGGVASDTGEIFVFAQPKHLAPYSMLLTCSEVLHAV